MNFCYKTNYGEINKTENLANANTKRVVTYFKYGEY